MEKDVGFIVKSSALFFIATILAKLISYGWMWYIANLGPQVLGMVSLSISFYSIYYALANIGFLKGIERTLTYVKENEGKERLLEVHSTMLTTSLLSNILFAGIIILLGKQLAEYIYKEVALYPVLVVIAIAVLFITPMKILGVIGWVKKRVYFIIISTTLLSSSVKLVSLILLLYFVSAEKWILGITSYIIGEMLASTLMFVWSINKLDVRLKFANPFQKKYIKNLKEILSDTLPVNISHLTSIIARNIDTAIINYIVGVANVGIYAVSFTILNLVLLPVQSLLPSLTIFSVEKKSRHEEERLKKTFSLIIKYVAIMFLYVYAIVLFYGTDILRILFGKEYERAYWVLVILMGGYILNAISYIYIRITWSEKKLTYLVPLYTITNILNIVLTIVLVFFWGIVGAAIATTTTMLITSFHHIYQSRKVLKIPLPLLHIISSFIILVIILYLTNKVFHIYIEYLNLWQGILMIIISTLIYGAILLITRTITLKEIKTIIGNLKGF